MTLKVAQDLQCATYVKEGVYVMVSGPSYETPAELRMLRGMGADVVGNFFFFFLITVKILQTNTNQTNICVLIQDGPEKVEAWQL